MKRAILAAALIAGGLFWAFLGGAGAQFNACAAGFCNFGGGGSPPPSYVGPLDVVGSNVVGCWALRACSSAARGTAAINVCNLGDAACADVLTDASTGTLPVSGSIVIGGQACSVTVSSGTYSSVTGIVTLTTATSSSLTSGNNFSVILTGTGSVASLNGQFSAIAGTTGTTVIYNSGSTGLTLTITGGMVSICTVKTIYDQSGAHACAGATACDLVQATIASRALLQAMCINTSFRCLSFSGGEGYNSANNLPTITQPYSQSLVAYTDALNIHSNTIFTSSTGGDLFGLHVNNLAEGAIYNGSYGTWTANDNAWNAMGVVGNAASSIYNNNGTAGTPTGNPGTTPPSGTMQMGYYTGAGTLFFDGYWVEGVFWSAGNTATQLNNVVSNQRGSANAGWNF
jgi:hypothetical protein